MKIISGNEIAGQISEKLTGEVKKLADQGIFPGLAVILVGEDPASHIYVSSKEKMCGRLGIHSIKRTLSLKATPQELDEVLEELNADKKIHGILCQFPLPSGFDERKVVLSILPEKDVDCFHPLNLGYLTMGEPRFVPCTPFGVIQILRASGVSTKGKNVVVLGRSNIVGRPLSILLSLKGYDGTVTVCHSQTENLEGLCAEADILIAAIGKPEFVRESHIKQGATVIDVGINRIPADNDKGYRIVGDVHFEEAKRKAALLTPVPGGVGPLTIQMLMYNTINAARLKNNLPILEL